MDPPARASGVVERLRGWRFLPHPYLAAARERLRRFRETLLDSPAAAPAVPVRAGAVPQTLCPNCGASALERFCAHCGQSQRETDTSLRQWLRESLEEFLSFETNKLPRTLGALLLRPGLLTLEWAAGRRARYIRPLRLYLAASLLFFLLWSFAPGGVESLTARFAVGLTHTGAAAPTAGGLVESWIAARSGGGTEMDLQSVQQALIQRLPYAWFLLLPAFAVLLKVGFLGAGRHFIAHLVFALHFHAFFYLVHVVLAPLEYLLAGTLQAGVLILPRQGGVEVFTSTAGLLGFLVATAYLVRAAARVYGGSVRFARLRMLVILQLHLFVLSFGTVAILLLGSLS